MNISRTINQFILWILILLCILSVIGLLNFGHGLGNIVYIIPIILLTILHIFLTIYARKKNKKSYYIPMAIFFGILSIGILYNATYGRGGEFSWNGKILFTKNTEYKNSTTTENTNKSVQICKPYFNYDNIEHYYLDISEKKVWEIDERKKSSQEKKIIELLIQYSPNKISDTIIFKDLEKCGFLKTVIKTSKFEQLDQIFCERKHNNATATSCIAIYRDILIFKKQNKIIGAAKICFDCGQNIILGAALNTEEFGQSGDYEKLFRILH